ncbi:MAG: bifunctional diaminohydroxyphosphoribosylaminopyrimidine deaminase/5-amino-6-(5-phosphoribosylamino)uracil reductase RibD [Xanthobacteraceae bacterium]
MIGHGVTHGELVTEIDTRTRRISDTNDARFMALALTLGRRGLGQTWPNPSVGAVIVAADGTIAGRGVTQPGGRPHAETEAISRAGSRAQGGTLYVTLEPCSHHGKTPPCVDAVLAAGIARVVSAIEDPNPEVAGRGHKLLREAGVTVDVGIGADEAHRDHAGHFRRVRDGRPQVVLKLAVSADNRVGLAGRRPVQISSDAARARVHMLRAQHDAIMIGIGTALADDPQLTCRLPGMLRRSPVRIVLDSQLRLPQTSALASTARDISLWVFCSDEVPAIARSALEGRGADVFAVPAVARKLDLSSALKAIAGRGITRLLVEGGPMIAASLVAADFADEVILVRSRTLIGDTGIDALKGMPLGTITQSPRFHLRDSETVGTDTFEFYERT